MICLLFYEPFKQTTLLFSPVDVLFHPGSGITEVPVCQGPSAVGLFCSLPDGLDVSTWVAIGLLAIVPSGWRPRITGLVHWCVSFSFMSSAVMVDGSDHVTAVLTFILLPLTLTDNRIWHWSSPAPGSSPSSLPDRLRRLVGRSSVGVARLQVAVIYFHASVGKMYTEEWAQGTAVYYWFTDPVHGAPDWLLPLLSPVITTGFGVTAITWGVIALELLLFLGLTLRRTWWKYLLAAGVFLHLGIAIVHGLWSFSVAMFGALILFLRPHDQPFSVALIRRWAHLWSFHVSAFLTRRSDDPVAPPTSR